MAGEPIQLELSGEIGRFALAWLDSASGGLQRTDQVIAGGGPLVLTPPAAGRGRPLVAWVTAAPP